MTKATLNKYGIAIQAGDITVYNYDAQNGEFTGSSKEYLALGVGLPAYSTAVAPPADIEGKACLFREERWDLVADHRGETVYCTDTGESIKITLPGDYPAGTTTLKPATAFDKWGGAAWVTDVAAQRNAAIAAAQEEKNTRISEAGSLTLPWQTQLALGIISDADKSSLIAWMKYLQAVQAVDVSLAPDITWPEKPE